MLDKINTLFKQNPVCSTICMLLITDIAINFIGMLTEIIKVVVK